MDEKVPRMRVQAQHWELILTFLESNPEMITGKFVNAESRRKQNILWQEMTIQLNALGGGEKSVQKWKDAVVDWKYKTKKKASLIGKEMGKTGAGGFVKPPSDYEERLMAVIGKTAVHGDPGLREIGLPQEDLMNDNVNDMEENMEVIQIVMSEQENQDLSNRTQSRDNKKENKKGDILERHQKETLQVLNNINSNVSNINSSLSNINSSLLTLIEQSNENMKNITSLLKIVLSHMRVE